MIPASQHSSLQDKLNELKATDGPLISKGMPVAIDQAALNPITGRIGRNGGQCALNSTIAEYAATPFTRSEMVTQLLKGYQHSIDLTLFT